MMLWTDTHTHLYEKEFDQDRDLAVERALKAGVRKMVLPCIDSTSPDRMQSLCTQYPEHFAQAIGLHPTSIGTDYAQVLDSMENLLNDKKWCAIGEIGLDFYWDTSMAEEQEKAFVRQIQWAVDLRIPVLIHTRKALDRAFELIKPYISKGLRGVFHCFPGDLNQAKRLIDNGFLLGIGGVVTFKNSKIAQIVKEVPLESLVLETDSPYLAPVPYRGTRNESSYIPVIGEKISQIRDCPLEEVATITTAAANSII